MQGIFKHRIIGVLIYFMRLVMVNCPNHTQLYTKGLNIKTYSRKHIKLHGLKKHYK